MPYSSTPNNNPSNPQMPAQSSHAGSTDGPEMTEYMLEGHISVRAALEADSRTVHRIVIDASRRVDRAVHALTRLAEAKRVSIEWRDEEHISELASGKTHGGVIAFAGERRYATLEQLIAGQENPLIVMLDGIEDPFNFGYAIRSIYAAGVHGIVVRPRNWMHAASVVSRASAGASERIPTAIADTALEAANFYRGKGIAVACTDSSDQATPLYEANLSGPLFILIGGEKRGITRSFMDQADIVLQIPYGRPFRHALSTDCAAAVLAFEMMRQRQAGKG